MNLTDRILKSVNGVKEASSNLARARENESRLYKGLERLTEYYKWEASNQNYIASLRDDDPRKAPALAAFMKERKSQDEIADKVRAYMLDAGIQLRTFIGISNDLAGIAKELIDLTQPILQLVVREEMDLGKATGSGSLSEDTTKASPHQAAAAQATNESKQELTSDANQGVPVNPAPAL